MAPEKKIFEIPDYEDAPLTDEELFRFRIGETDCALIRADCISLSLLLMKKSLALCMAS